MEERHGDRLGRVLGSILFSRITINTAFRMTYPFLPAISRGLGVSFQTSGLLVTTRSLGGLSALFFGPFGDRFGRRTTMILGLTLFIVGASLVGSLPVFWITVVAFALIGMAKSAYDPAMQAYLSERVPYDRRARILGFTELSWAGGWLLGVPVSGYMIGHFGWQSPWLLMAAVAMPSLLLTFFLPVRDESRPCASPSWSQGSIVSLLRTPRVPAALVTVLLIPFANEQFFVVYGAWMEHVFGLGPMALGVVSLVIGFAELAGEIGVTLFTDRLGKGRSLLIGIMFTGFFYLAVPFLSQSMVSTLVGLGVLFFAYEFAIVSSIPLVSELVPERRNTMMACFLATATAGRALGAVCGPRLWGATEDLRIHGIVSVLCMTGAFLVGTRVLSKEEGRAFGDGFRRSETNNRR